LTDERRKDKRVMVLIDLLWEGQAGRSEARTSDLSTGGCFIDTMGEAAEGDIITFKLQLPNGQWIEVEGEVTFSSPRVGFGVRFTNMSEPDRKKLEWLVKASQYQEDKKGRRVSRR